MHLVEHFDRGAMIAPDKPVVIFEDQEWSYAQAQLENLKIANALRVEGTTQSTKCAVISDNHPASYQWYLGASQCKKCATGPL